MNLIAKDRFELCYITDFPMYEKNEEGKLDFTHNPFSMPQGGLEALETMNPLEIKAYQYDIVCNGVELSSGAVRNHRPDIMVKPLRWPAIRLRMWRRGSARSTMLSSMALHRTQGWRRA